MAEEEVDGDRMEREIGEDKRKGRKTKSEEGGGGEEGLCGRDDESTGEKER